MEHSQPDIALGIPSFDPSFHRTYTREQPNALRPPETAAFLGIVAKKYPQHKPDQKCSNCQFWQGAASDAWAGCAMFGRKQIAAGGWCMAYKKIG